MEYQPVRTVRDLWRLDLNDFHEGFDFAASCCEAVNPMAVSRSWYLGWVHGCYECGANEDADVEALRADMDLNMGSSEWVH